MQFINKDTLIFAAIAVTGTAILHARGEHLDRFIAKATIYEPRPRTSTSETVEDIDAQLRRSARLAAKPRVAYLQAELRLDAAVEKAIDPEGYAAANAAIGGTGCDDLDDGYVYESPACATPATCAACAAHNAAIGRTGGDIYDI